MKVYFYIATVLLVLSLVEAISFLTTGYLQTKGVFYTQTVSDSYEDYLLRRDSLLGWPPPDKFEDRDDYDLMGGRIVPSFPDEARYQNCISLYGDSFTWSSQVNHEHAWGTALY